MPYKTVSISARISQEDAEFLSQLTIAGAKTPSDKLRAILTAARERHPGEKNYRQSLHMMQEMFVPLLERIQQAEYETGEHSELVVRLLQWLPDMMAYVSSGVPGSQENDKTQQLRAFEHGIVERVFRLIESVMQLGVTQKNSCYDSNVINDRIAPMLELADVIAHIRK